MTVITKNTDETIKLGEKVAKFLKPGDVLCLSGDLGSGKTTFVKGIAKGMNISKDKVHSPTFVLMNLYEGKIPLCHFDLYRVDPKNEINTVGYDEFLYGQGISVIEWAEKFGNFLPEEYLKVEFKHSSENVRRITFLGIGKRYKEVIKKLKNK